MPTIAGDRGTRVNRAGTTGVRRGFDRRRHRARGRLLRVRLRCKRPWPDRPWYDRPAGRRKARPTSGRPPPDSGRARAATGRLVDDRLQVNHPPGGGRHAQRHSYPSSSAVQVRYWEGLGSPAQPAAFSSKANPRSSFPDPRLARSRKRVSASNSASTTVVISSIRRLSGVPRLLASALSGRCFSSGRRTVSAVVSYLLQAGSGRRDKQLRKTQLDVSQMA